MKKFGDAIASVATPIARVLKLDCIDQETQDLKPESQCAQNQRKLNEVYDWLFNKPKEETMQFRIQIAVEAVDLKAAITSDLNKGIVLSANPASQTPILPPSQGQPNMSPALRKHMEGKTS